jgi:hypothetical protein
MLIHVVIYAVAVTELCQYIRVFDNGKIQVHATAPAVLFTAQALVFDVNDLRMPEIRYKNKKTRK